MQRRTRARRSFHNWSSTLGRAYEYNRRSVCARPHPLRSARRRDGASPSANNKNRRASLRCEQHPHIRGRDREYVDAARSEGLRVGFYYSLMDKHHPDGARCAKDEAARKRFVDYIHRHVRELMTNYGKIDVLWYDVAWPLDAAGWE